jgi:hypothetical protein
MNAVEENYNILVKTTSDINEHLPVLKKYAEQCDHVTEMGVRYIVSTFALVLAKPKKLIAIDLFHPSHYGDHHRLDSISKYAKDNSIDFSFKLQNTLDCTIEPTDMLFIDTLHRYGQLKAELERHVKNVKKYLVFHDTTSFENTDEPYYYENPRLDTSKTGLWPAIQEFLDSNTEWEIAERFTNNNGLTILQKKVV